MERAVVVLAVIVWLFGSAASGSDPAAEEAVRAGTRALAEAERGVLRSDLTDLLGVLRAAAPAADAGPDETRRLAAVSHLADARVAAAKGELEQAGRSLRAAVERSETEAEVARCWRLGMEFLSDAAESGAESGFSNIAGVLRSRVAPRLDGPDPFIELAGAWLRLDEGFMGARAPLVLAMERAEDLSSWRSISRLADRLAARLDDDHRAVVNLFTRLAGSVPEGRTGSFFFHEASFRALLRRSEFDLAAQSAERMLAAAEGSDQELAALSGFQALALELDSADEPEASAEAFSRAVEVGAALPFSSEAAVSRGNFLRRTGRGPDAEGVFREGLGRLRGDPDLTLALCDLLLEAGRPDEAEGLVEDALKRAPSDQGLLFLHVRVLAGQGRFDEAAEVLTVEEVSARDRFRGAEVLERAKGFEAARTLLDSIPPDAVQEDSWLARRVPDLAVRLLRARLESARSELGRSVRLRELFGDRAREARAAGDEAGFERNDARRSVYHQEVRPLSRLVRRLENELEQKEN